MKGEFVLWSVRSRSRGLIAKANAVATVDGEVACEAEVTFALYNDKEA